MTRVIIIAAILVTLFVLIFYSCHKENFWGGYFPVPYNGQTITQYNRNGFEAATDNPRMIINPESCPINPYICPKCNSYRCCCN